MNIKESQLRWMQVHGFKATILAQACGRMKPAAGTGSVLSWQSYSPFFFFFFLWWVGVGSSLCWNPWLKQFSCLSLLSSWDHRCGPEPSFSCHLPKWSLKRNNHSGGEAETSKLRSPPPSQCEFQCENKECQRKAGQGATPPTSRSWLRTPCLWADI